MRRLLALVWMVGVLGAQELPKCGTLGDLPPENRRIEVSVLTDGAIRVGEEEIGFPALRAKLRSCEPGTDVLLRIDRRGPWVAVQWVMIACAQADLARVFHAVRPEDSEEEGALALFLPKDRGRRAVPQRPHAFEKLRVHVVAREQPVFLDHLHPVMSKLAGGDRKIVLDLKAARHTPYEICVRICDLALRAGIEHVQFYGTQVAPRDADLKKIVAMERSGGKRPEAFGIKLGARELEPSDEPVDVPAGKRVRGGYAGIARSDSFPFFEEEEEIDEDDLPEEVIEEEEIVDHAKADDTSGRIDRALKWLAAHQDEDGRWDCDGFTKQGAGRGSAEHDVGVTGLAVLAFLGANYTDRSSRRFENPYAGTVRKALRFLMAQQQDDGHFGSRTPERHVYGHAIATFAMCQAYAHSRNPRYRKPAQNGLDWIARARNPYMAWRYEPRDGGNDTSVTAWCVQATHAGKHAGLDIDPDAFEGTRQWFAKITDPETGRAGYRERGKGAFRPEELAGKFAAVATRAPSAAALAGRRFHGYPARDKLVKKQAAIVAALPPKWETARIDLAYWYWGTVGLRGLEGDAWKSWSEAMTGVLKKQRDDGSWDPAGVWGNEGGRVYATAVLAICAQHVAPYDRAFHVK